MWRSCIACSKLSMAAFNSFIQAAGIA